ncbi:MAG: hypothetical protein GY923_05660 [Aestuariibacter sp.]|nr:hypothetical protein [Aestuariibacter sp.]
MWIFLRQIPKGTTGKELGKFVSKGQQPFRTFSPLPSRAKIKRCEILQIFNPETQITEYHGLIQIDPFKAALPLIERLNGRELQGKPIEVRKYYRRLSYLDSQRILSEREEQQELRQQDRRRDRLSPGLTCAPTKIL